MLGRGPRLVGHCCRTLRVRWIDALTPRQRFRQLGGIARFKTSFPVRCESRSDIADIESCGVREPLRLGSSVRHSRSGFHRFRRRVRELFPRWR